MTTFLLAVLLLAVGVAGMAVTILLKKDGKFPDGEISHNKELRKKGIICAKEEELRLWGKRGTMRRKHSAHTPDSTCPEGGCEGCAFRSDSSAV
ncbi:MAG: hypothetical protein KBT00_03015 [Bacteroidales bacterium]|nr:hypothetical protein [Candidatus Cacconaster merdequi]